MFLHFTIISNCSTTFVSECKNSRVPLRFGSKIWNRFPTVEIKNRLLSVGKGGRILRERNARRLLIRRLFTDTNPRYLESHDSAALIYLAEITDNYFACLATTATQPVPSETSPVDVDYIATHGTKQATEEWK